MCRKKGNSSKGLYVVIDEAKRIEDRQDLM